MSRIADRDRRKLREKEQLAFFQDQWERIDMFLDGDGYKNFAGQDARTPKEFRLEFPVNRRRRADDNNLGF